MAVNIRSLTAGLEYPGEVTGKKQRYFVFEGRKSCFVWTFSKSKRSSDNFNLVSVDAVQYLRGALQALNIL